MNGLKIGVVGALDETYGTIQNGEEGRNLSRKLGKQLADRGHSLVVYSDNKNFLDYYAVDGYLESEAKQEKGIIVRYSRMHNESTGAGEVIHPFQDFAESSEYFHFQPHPTEDWEAPFYKSLKDLDGIIMMGGGDSTEVVGYISMVMEMPILCYPNYGGSAQEIYDSLSVEHPFTKKDMLQRMAAPYSRDTASQGIDDLVRQIEDKQKLEAEKEEKLRKEIKKGIVEEVDAEKEAQKRSKYQSLLTVGLGVFTVLMLSAAFWLSSLTKGLNEELISNKTSIAQIEKEMGPLLEKIESLQEKGPFEVGSEEYVELTRLENKLAPKVKKKKSETDSFESKSRKFRNFWNWMFLVIFSTPLVAGPLGSVVQQLSSEKTENKLGRIMGLGFIAGFVSLGLFLLAQLAANQGLFQATPGEATNTNLFFFCLYSVIISFVAGFTFEKVFEKVAGKSVVDEELV